MTQTDLSKRTPEEVFTHHAQALGAEDLDAILMDYADAATLISPSGVLRGKDAIRQFFADLLQALEQDVDRDFGLARLVAEHARALLPGDDAEFPHRLGSVP